MDAIPYGAGAFYIFDKGYVDFTRLYHIDNEKTFFVIRAKHNIRFTRLESFAVDKATGVRVDQRIKFPVFYYPLKYPDHLR